MKIESLKKMEESCPDNHIRDRVMLLLEICNEQLGTRYHPITSEARTAREEAMMAIAKATDLLNTYRTE